MLQSLSFCHAQVSFASPFRFLPKSYGVQPETDRLFPLTSRRRAEDILVEKKATYTIQVFSGVAHGFAVRGDPNVGDIRKLVSHRYFNITS